MRAELTEVWGWFLSSGTRSAETFRIRSTPPVFISATWVAISGMARMIRCLKGGLPRQCWSKASRRMSWSRFHSTNFQGPVPTGAGVLPGHDGEEAQPLQQEREGLVGDDVDRLRVDDADLLDRADIAVLRGLLLLVEHPLEGVLDVLGAHGVAVVELDALAQLELPLGVAQRLPVGVQ